MLKSMEMLCRAFHRIIHLLWISENHATADLPTAIFIDKLETGNDRLRADVRRPGHDTVAGAAIITHIANRAGAHPATDSGDLLHLCVEFCLAHFTLKATG